MWRRMFILLVTLGLVVGGHGTANAADGDSSGAFLGGVLANSPGEAALQNLQPVSGATLEVVGGHVESLLPRGGIHVVSSSYGVSTPAESDATLHSPRPQVDSLSVTKFVDPTSPVMFLLAARGDRLPEVTLRIEMGSIEQPQALIVRLRNVSLTAVRSVMIPTSDGLRQGEDLIFRFEDIQITHEGPDGRVSTEWNVVEGTGG